MLNQVGEMSLIYSQAARNNSVFSVDDTESVAQIKQIISDTKDLD
jgi:hypothetical protein